MSTHESAPQGPIDLSTHALKAACATCNIRELCVPGGIASEDIERLDQLVARRKKVKKGAALFNAGDEFQSLFAVRTGFFKTCIQLPNGEDQITGFQMPGELLGLDGVANEQHNVEARALVDSELCVLPYNDLERIARDFRPLQHQLHRLMSREIVRENSVLMLLGSMRAEARVAAFLVNLSERFRRLGFSSDEFLLRMTRSEIGSYLGLKLETVSRTFSKLQERGIIAIDKKLIHILDQPELRKITKGEAEL
ncbi:MAG: fumarate/nitrate reduction transcriptional regulator Fnr [Pseudomonadota bacterium]